jgi:hypothetical protein
LIESLTDTYFVTFSTSSHRADDGRSTVAMNIWLDLPSQLRVELSCAWLGLQDLARLDEAFTGAPRMEYLDSIQTDQIRLSGGLVVSNNTASSAIVGFLRWIDGRNIRVNTISFTENVKEEVETLFTLIHHQEICESIVDISFQHPSYVNVDVLLPLILRCCRLEKLNLSNCSSVTDSFFRMLESTSRNSAEVNDLEPCNKRMKIEEPQRNHKEMDISEGIFGNATQTKSMPALHSHPFLPVLPLSRLQAINFSHCKSITIDTIRALGTLNKVLSSLNLRGCIELGGDSLLQVADNWKSMRELDLSFCKKINNAAMVAAMNKFGSAIEALNLYYCRMISDEAILAIANRCTYLRDLNVQGCNDLTDAAICTLAEKCHHLESLTISNCTKITDQSLIALAVNSPQLRRLQMNHCKQIRQDGIVALSENSHGLIELQAKDCSRVTDEAFRSQGIVWMKLEEIYLDYCEEITDFTLLQIARQCPRLLKFSVTGCPKIQYPAMREATSLNPFLHIRVEQE